MSWWWRVSTLAVAALFNPLRRYVKSFVDRRFDRSRYDASLVADDFAARLRNEVDLDGLTVDLTRVVGDTLHPQTISLWLRQEAS